MPRIGEIGGTTVGPAVIATKGNDGQPGYDGNDGDDGYPIPGSQGMQGVQGIQGIQGPAGPSGGALILLEQHAASNSATLDFVSFYSSTYDDYLIEIVGLTPGTNNVDLDLQLSTNGGSTWESSSNYYSALSGVQNNAATFSSSQNPGTAYRLCQALQTAAGRTIGGSLRLHSLGTALNPEIFGNLTYTNQGWAVSVLLMGVLVLTSNFNAARFFMSTGNIASGSIRIYGIAK